MYNLNLKIPALFPGKEKRPFVDRVTYNNAQLALDVYKEFSLEEQQPSHDVLAPPNIESTEKLESVFENLFEILI